MPLDEIWSGDLLDRQRDAEFLQTFLLNRINERHHRGVTRSYVLNVDAEYGRGKTYFLSRFAVQLREAGHIVAEVNAWRDDHADDPLLAVMSAIDEAISPTLNNQKKLRDTWQTIKRSSGAIAIAAAKGTLLHWLRKGMGDGIDDALDAFSQEKDGSIAAAEESAATQLEKAIDSKAEALIAGFKAEKQSLKAFRDGLTLLMASLQKAGDGTTLFVLVDELDRCRPSYAIALLERVKHLFEIDHIVFVVATDTDQLQHAIAAVYGQNFNSHKYLRRFFDRAYRFADPTTRRFTAALLDQFPFDPKKISLPPSIDLDRFLSDAFDYFALSLRDIEQCFDILRSIVTVWGEGVPVELVALVPLVVGHQQGMEVVVSPGFIPELLKKSEQKVKIRSKWEISDQDYQSHKYYELSVQELFKDLAENVALPLHKISEVEIRTQLGEWRREIFRKEFRILHRNQYNNRNPPYSIIRDYPSLVMGAGRLT